jgi:dTDP-4-amino-4,6-dideoxygalactose transaminase
MKYIYWWKNYNFFFENKTNFKKIISSFDVNKKYIQFLEKKLARMLGVNYIVFTTSGSSALTLALHAVGLKTKMKVTIPDRTWVATAHAAYNMNHILNIVDVSKKTLNLDLNNKNLSVLKNSDVAITVNINGKNCQIGKLNKNNKKLVIIEDSAQSFLSFRSKINNKIKVSCYSTGSTKLLNTFQGGFCATNNKKLYNKILLSRNHGVYDFFTDKWRMPGYNLKPTNLQCFIGINELKNIKQKKANCKKIFNLYRNQVKNKKVKVFDPEYSKNEFPLYVMAVVENKNKFINYMKKKKVQIRPLPPPISSANYFIKKKIKLNNSQYIYKKFIYLPCGPSQKIEDIKRVIKIINKF